MFWYNVLETYIDNIRHEDFQPSWAGSDIQVCGMLSRNEHFSHKAQLNYMDQGTDFQYKPCYRDTHCHVDIRLF